MNKSNLASLRTIAIIAGFMLGSAQVSASSFTIEPGLWQFTPQSMTLPGQESTVEQCIRDAEFDPSTMANTGSQDSCDLLEQATTENKYTFKMQCNESGAAMQMQGVYESFGDSIKGTINMQMKFGEQTMKHQIVWRGNRVGDC